MLYNYKCNIIILFKNTFRILDNFIDTSITTIRLVLVDSGIKPTVYLSISPQFLRCDSLNSTRQGREMGSKNPVRLEIGHKSNRMNLRFLVSSIGSTTANASQLGATVYNIFCVGMEAYACIEQDGYSASFIYRPPIYDGPLALNASVGYKFAEVPRITNDLWVLNLRCTLA